MRSALVRLLTGLVVACVMLGTVQAAEPVLSFDTPEQERMYKRLITEYRCLKCQNQNLADSSADLAGDLRREVYSRVIAGESKSDIDGYLTARYGDFVLYRPPFRPVTWLLWLGPFALLILATVYAIRLTHRRNSPASVSANRNANDASVDSALDAARKALGTDEERADRY